MKNIGKNSWSKKLLKNLFLFILIFSLTFGGFYLYFTEPRRQVEREIESIKNTHYVKYKDFPNHEIELINEENLLTKECIIKKLKLFDLDHYRKKRFGELLEEIAKEINEEIEQEMLEKKNAEEKKQIIQKVLKVRSMLGGLENAIDPSRDSKNLNCIAEQNKWYAEYYPHGFREDLLDNQRSLEDKKVIKELGIFINNFYEKFREVKNFSDPKIIQPIKTLAGNEENEEKFREEVNKKIDELKTRLPSTEYDELMKPNWLGFKGWHREENPEKGTVSIGLTSYTASSPYENDPTFLICHTRNISITLDRRFAFGRKGKKYDSWVIKKDGKFSKLRIGWNALIETISHELAHAIINSIRVYYRHANKEEGGHGTLHHRYTREIKEMIKDSEEYQKLKTFWFKNS